MNLMVKIISPTNEITELKYYDILYFCQRITEEYIEESEENLKEFVEFRSNYNHFYPYFDFVMLKLKYILINPLFYKNSYLLPYNDKYYIMDLDTSYEKYSYDELIQKVPNFSFDFLAATDQNICIDGNNSFIKERIGFCLDQEGNIYKNYIAERHLKMESLILNQQMINSVSVCKKYKKFVEENGQNRLGSFLVDELGFVVGFPSDEKTVIYNSKMVTKEQMKYLNLFKTKYQIKEENNYRKFR